MENKPPDFGYSSYNGRCGGDGAELESFNCRVSSVSLIFKVSPYTVWKVVASPVGYVPWTGRHR